MSDRSGDSRTKTGTTSADPDGDRAGLAAHVLESSDSGSGIGEPDSSLSRTLPVLRREHIADLQHSDGRRLEQAENVADQVMMVRRRDRFYKPTREQLNAVYDAGMMWVDYSLGRYGLMSRVEYQSYSSVTLAKAELMRRKNVAKQTEALRKSRSKRRCCVVM
ncbi:hypothetical protein EJ03DRAFT_208714 [Teratosphaeria nubilosa]|uniref:Uncharacterized protein n=1 Tax=Teratosphaeria nubilosa TaxID=161662 RepID=A0A6G1KXV4_9PEZI|nr:hypothetical protein EJ03DRAFT_208714 [Teratosphaeria nubilosa]